jgi:zinc/manganese transport system substrate-binding protein
MAPFRGREIVTYHRSWTYLTEFFGLQIAAEIEPKPGIPPSPGHTREVIDAIVSKKVGVIIQEPYYAPSEGQAISERTGAAFVVLPSMVGGAPEALSYPDLFETIVVKLLKTFEAPR